MSLYKDGIRFTCQKCGVCCISQSDTMCVHLFKPDILALVFFLKIDPKAFVDQHCLAVRDTFLFTDCTIVQDRIELRKKRGGACVFLEKNQCSVYAARPFLCKAGPFISGFMYSRLFWKLFKSYCIGVGTGKFHSADEIDRTIAREQAVDEEYENDLCVDPFLKDIFKKSAVVRREIKIDATYDRYRKSKA
ncbi:MAG: hypothetical protein A2268_04960 [Candidatus Raymondbacteria bacterium RifOxyA12_full_50_37]|uniref:Fe-S oxidoreductase n=1 Tax=Candidatus Raymondbacteria bacterium RIFOXYD12_FULL_49_13 TaxID=1817890 RepID=A0A1F7FD94_UNCRA|nr:MAG: hypothetical protein A2268_04960 [Candidatus Raymondbacteria bacterium RifOxyA12_full_50_37]OGJ94093.1 MAG: hypothetical protein A2248_12165 [Candidatus Raymondbacteria bacterium RIFOXYA2_FULL_49_16]OGJ96918.1 MAG: hypothetical protein A2453_04765 [Candidatus Raymondbacteria bacterium RIFOXYC2_FULL_50_21]OGK03020.1 MAG: hypothetical protein A2350_03630 [Candidatus Raymondbacteria bacterium RifOxyB12_full_50_8]OGK04644.1 MAG: hypothetical protein A2519_20930 [Candidatus Raymondbacteria b